MLKDIQYHFIHNYGFSLLNYHVSLCETNGIKNKN